MNETNETIQLSAVVDVRLPMLPNFLRSSKDEGPVLFPLSAFSEADLRRIGQAWTEALIAKAKSAP